MKLLVFGRPTSYAEQQTFQALLDRAKRAGRTVELVETTSREGIARMQIYDVVTTPALVVVNDDGVLIAGWQHRVPSYDELNDALGTLV